MTVEQPINYAVSINAHAPVTPCAAIKTTGSQYNRKSGEEQVNNNVLELQNQFAFIFFVPEPTTKFQ